MRGVFRGGVLTAVLLLAACEGSVTVDLSVAGADVFDRARLPVDGVEFRFGSGDTKLIRFDDPRDLNLLNLRDGEVAVLLSGEEIPERDYDGVRLLLDTDDVADDAAFERSDGTSAPVTLSGVTSYADIDLEVVEDEDVTVLLVLELPFSVSRVRAGGDQLLTPVLRAVSVDDAASISGTVDPDAVEAEGCNADDGGRAVYVFRGRPDTLRDYSTTLASSNRPLAGAKVQRSGDDYRYTVEGLAEGTYTVAFTCDADLDDPLSEDGLLFTRRADIEIDNGEDATLSVDEVIDNDS